MELTFGEQIKIILKRKNMTIRQLAELIEVQTGKPMSRQNLTQKLNRDNFQEQDMREVAQALGCLVQISVIDPMEATVASLQSIMPAKPVSDETMVLSDETMVLSDETMVLPDDMTAFSGHTAAVSDETMILPEESAGSEGKDIAGQTEAAAWPGQSAAQGRGRLVRGGRRTMAVPKPTIGPEPEPARRVVKPAEEKLPEPAENVRIEIEAPGAATAAEPENSRAAAWNERNSSGAEAAEQTVDVNGDLLKEIEQALSQSVESELRGESGAGSAEQSRYAGSGSETGRDYQEPQNDPLAWASRRPTVWPTLHIPEEPAQAEEEPAGGAGDSAEAERDAGSFEEEIHMPSLNPENWRHTDGETDTEQGSEMSAQAETAESVPQEPDAGSIKPGEEELLSAEPLDDLEFEPIEVESEVSRMNREVPERDGTPEYAEVRAENVRAAEHTEAASTGAAEHANTESESMGAAKHVKAENDWTAEHANAGDVPLADPQPQEEIHPEQLVQLDPVFFELDELDGGDVSGVSAPYSIKREDSSENSGSGTESENGDDDTDENEEDGHAPIDYRSMSSIPGGDVSYVSAPYVIEREEEPEEPAYNGYYEIPEDELADITFDESEDRIPDFGETKEGPDLGKKLAEWDAAVQKSLEKPLFLTPEERRARREAEEAEKARAAAEAEAADETAGLPTVDPATGQEYATNTVMHHPSKPDTLLVYDSDEHRWIEQNERAFNNFQIRKRALLGKDYEPPVYLD